MNNLSKVIGLGGRRLNRALAMHYLFGEQVKPPEYIEFNGNRYVKLDLPFTKDTVCRIKFNMTKATGDCIMGSSGAFRFFNAAGRTYLDWGGGKGGGRIYETTGKTPAGVTHYREFGDNYVKDAETGEILVSGEKYGDSVTYDGLPICIMGNPYQKCARGIVYLVEVIQNGKTVRLLLPYIGDEGEFGFRDSITGNFYSVIDKQHEYIEFDGTQYVKLDLPFTDDTVCRIKFNTTKATGNCIMGSSNAFRFFNAYNKTYLDWGAGKNGGRIYSNDASTPEGKTHYREFGNNYVKDAETGKIIISGEKYGDGIRYDGLPICIMGNPYQKCTQGIVYSAEVIQNGETVRLLLPYFGSAGELGFRDAVTGKFYWIIDTATASVMSLRMADETSSTVYDDELEVTEDDIF